MRKLILTGLAACSLLLMQSCSKKESLTGIKTTATNSSKLKVRDVYITGTVPTGTYKFTTDATYSTTNKAMGVAATRSLGAAVQQQDYTVNTGSDWRVTSLGNGYYSIINVYSGLAMTLSDGAAPEHAVINQYSYGGIDAQQWAIEYQGAFSVYRIKSKINVLKGANVDPYSTSSGTPIKLETYPTANQAAGYFLITPVVIAYQDDLATGLFKRDFTTGWNAGDGSHSVQLADGRILWGMGDSGYDIWTSPNGGTVNCGFQVRNAAMVQAAGNWSPAAVLSYKGSVPVGGGFPSFYQYAPNPANYIWVSDGVQIGNNTYMYCNVRSSDSIAPVQQQLAKMTIASGAAPSSAAVTYINLQTNLTQSITNGHRIFGRSFIKDGAWIYVYGTKSIDAFSSELLVARFANSDAGITGTWSFYKGGDYTLAASWSSDVTLAISIRTLTYNGITVAKVNSKYVLLSSDLAYFCGTDSRNIYSCTSSSPVGPFNTDKVVYTISDALNNGYSPYWYGVIVHPEFTANNELLITYNKNGYICDTLCSGGRQIAEPFRPRAVRIPFAVIDPAL